VVLHFGWHKKLLATKLGGNHWRIVSEYPLLFSVFPFRGKVYFPDQWREGLIVVEAKATQPKLVLAARWPLVVFKFVQMADCAGVLLLLTNYVYYLKGSENYTVDFDTFRMDADARPLILVRDIDERAMFLLVITAVGWP
jgi:hypothetical protein